MFFHKYTPPAEQKTFTSVTYCLKFSEIPVLQDQLPVSLLLSLSVSGLNQTGIKKILFNVNLVNPNRFW